MSKPADASSPLAAKTVRAPGLGCIALFALVFAAAGLTAFWFITLRPLLLAQASADWVETPAEVLSSELQRNASSDGTTYRVLIRYRYEWEGRAYESERFDFSSGASNIGVPAMRAAVKAHPPGHRTVCYVDPENPASAVLDRDPPGTLWFGLFTLLFPLLGAFLFFRARRASRRAAAGENSPLAGASATRVSPGLRRGPKGVADRLPDARDPITPGEVLLKPAAGRVGAAVGLGLFAVVWNGFILFAASDLLRGSGGGIAWFALLFLLPFAAVGLLMIGLALQAFSRLFAPAVELRLDPSRLRLGERLPFTWRLGGGGVRRLRVRLVAREEASYRQGTRTTTDKADFHRELLVDSTDTLGLAEGRGELVLPADAAAPAFSALNNRLVWELVFEGEIPWRADIDDRFALPVRGPEKPLALAATPEPREHRGGGFTLWTVDHFAPGETLVFTLARDADATGPAGPLSVQLGWFTEGKGTRDADIVWREALPRLEPGADRGLEVRLPEAPWSFAGKLVAVQWRLELLNDDGAPLLGVPLVIAPGGAAMQLPALEPEPSSFAARKARFRARRGR